MAAEQDAEQAPNAEMKGISLTSKELCGGAAQPIPIPRLRRLSQFHVGFRADGPDPDTLYICVGSRRLFQSFLEAWLT